MNRRSFLKLMGGGVAAAAVAPAIITNPGVLMPVKKLASDAVEGAVFFDGRIWMYNNGASWLTVTAMECGDWKVATPRPIDLQPGESLVYDGRVAAFSKYSPSPVVVVRWDERNDIVPHVNDSDELKR